MVDVVVCRFAKCVSLLSVSVHHAVAVHGKYSMANVRAALPRRKSRRTRLLGVFPPSPETANTRLTCGVCQHFQQCQPPVCCWCTSMTSPSSISNPSGVSLSLMASPSSRKRMLDLLAPCRKFQEKQGATSLSCKRAGPLKDELYYRVIITAYRMIVLCPLASVAEWCSRVVWPMCG